MRERERAIIWFKSYTGCLTSLFRLSSLNLFLDTNKCKKHSDDDGPATTGFGGCGFGYILLVYMLVLLYSQRTSVDVMMHLLPVVFGYRMSHYH